MVVNFMKKTIKEPLVSIIMPAYNAEDTIKESVKSVLDQTYTNWELLIADDCSSDTTREILNSYAKIDNRILPVFLNENGGPARARNASLQKSSGELIAFLDSDDMWLSNKLEICIEALIASNAAICFTGFRRVSSDGDKIGHYISVPESTTYKKVLGGNVIATSTVLINKSLSGDFRMKETFYDDFDCWLQILKSGRSAIGVDIDLMRYRVLEGSVSRNKFKSSIEVWKALRNLEKIRLLPAIKYFISYAIKGYLKYRKF